MVALWGSIGVLCDPCGGRLGCSGALTFSMVWQGIYRHGALWGSIGVLWGPYGGRLGCFGGPRGGLWGVLGACWGPLGATGLLWGLCRGPLGVLWGSLGFFGGILGSLLESSVGLWGCLVRAWKLSKSKRASPSLVRQVSMCFRQLGYVQYFPRCQ